MNRLTLHRFSRDARWLEYGWISPLLQAFCTCKRREGPYGYDTDNNSVDGDMMTVGGSRPGTTAMAFPRCLLTRQ